MLHDVVRKMILIDNPCIRYTFDLSIHLRENCESQPIGFISSPALFPKRFPSLSRERRGYCEDSMCLPTRVRISNCDVTKETKGREDCVAHYLST